MDLSGKFGSDADKEVKGVRHDLDATTWIVVARMHNKRYADVFNAKMKPHQQAQRLGTLSEDIAQRVWIEALAEAILLDWGGMTDDGKELPPTLENRIAILKAEHLKDFRLLVERLANEADHYRQQSLAAGAEKLKSGSGGKSSGAISSSGSST